MSVQLRYICDLGSTYHLGMGTPATALSSLIHTVVVWFGVLWVSALCISRIYMFHEAYQTIIQHMENDSRLRQMCLDPEFYSIIKQHADVCIQVQKDAEVNPWLKALNIALAAPTLCGQEACSDIITRVCVRGGWTAVVCALLVIIFSPHVLMPLFRATRQVFIHDGTQYMTQYTPTTRKYYIQNDGSDFDYENSNKYI
jgi:hypothetical protein